MFDSYNSRGPLYVIHVNSRDKEGNLVRKLYQYHPAGIGSGPEFRDADDQSVGMDYFVQQHPELKTISEFKGSHEAFPMSKEEQTNLITSGKFQPYQLNNLDETQKKLLHDGYMKKFKSGYYTLSDLNHATRNGYLTDDHKEELKKQLLYKIRQGKYLGYELTHAKKNGYFTDDHLKELSIGFMKKLNDGDLGMDEHDIAKEHGYLNPSHVDKMYKNSIKFLSNRGDVDGSIKHHLINIGWFNIEEYEDILGKRLKKLVM